MKERVFFKDKNSLDVQVQGKSDGKVAESFLQLPVPIGGRTGAPLLAADGGVARVGEDLPTEWIVRMAEAVGAVLSRVMGYR